MRWAAGRAGHIAAGADWGIGPAGHKLGLAGLGSSAGRAGHKAAGVGRGPEKAGAAAR